MFYTAHDGVQTSGPWITCLTLLPTEPPFHPHIATQPILAENVLSLSFEHNQIRDYLKMTLILLVCKYGGLILAHIFELHLFAPI